jgi:transcriptional regulator with XRE-family HTH domain
MTNLKAIGARVRELRLAENIGQEELAAIIGISRSTLAGIETGKDRGGIETMIAIADHYKVPMDWLLARKLPPGSPPIGKLVYRADQISILALWENLPVQFKETWRDMLAGIGLPETVGSGEPQRRVRRKSTASA